MSASDKAPMDTQIVYVLNGIPLLPHYLHAEEYVYPGYKRGGKTFTAKELMGMGAVPRKECLPLRANR